jgi:signal transduction histidine kinase/CheY-like chemotaxis protein
MNGLALPPAMLARARADQVAQLYAGWHRTSASMLLGGTLLCTVMWGQVSPWWMAAWGALIVANQAWRGVLAHAWRREQPGIDAAARWGRYWAVGSTLGGVLWGVAGLVMFPSSTAHQALLIVCIFGVVLGGLNLTAVYRPAFYGFVLPALVPIIVRVALETGQVHLYTAVVMGVVGAFVLLFGHQLNDVLTRSLAMRYENLDLIAELKARSRTADEARAAAEAANRGKSQLLAAASHDLRQPLHALGLYTAALAVRAAGTEMKPLVRSVQGAVAALEGQFEQLLDLSRLEVGGFAPAWTRVALAPLFARVLAELQPLAADKGLALRARASTHAVVSDAALLERVIRNLACNALRYTRNGGVLLVARRHGDAVAIDVVDTGIGIAPADCARIFEEFYQVHSSSTPAHGGMGLGLAIVRRLAVLLRHEVAVTSREGRGSRFRVTAPAAAGLPRPLRLQDTARPPRPGGCGVLEGSVVAVIDDDTAALDAMGVLFETWGAEVVGASDTTALLARVGGLERYPDLVVADLRLADGQNGVHAVHRLRDALGVRIPGLIVSGDTSAHADAMVRAAGFTLLGKPVVPDVLHALASTLIARHAAQVA